jgi:hypothetical protein
VTAPFETLVQCIIRLDAREWLPVYKVNISTVQYLGGQNYNVFDGVESANTMAAVAVRSGSRHRGNGRREVEAKSVGQHQRWAAKTHIRNCGNR